LKLTAIATCFNMANVQAQVADTSLTSVTEIISDVTDVVVPPDVTNIRIGFGPVYSPDYEGSDDYKVRFRPLVSFRYRNLIHVDNNHLRINLSIKDGGDDWHFNAGPLLKVDFGRNKSDNPDLAGLGGVGTSVELGVFTSYTIGATRVRLRLQQDVTSGHSGTMLAGDVRVILNKTGKLVVIGSINSTWADSAYMDAYFSVNEVQSLGSGLPVFNAGPGVKDIRLALGANLDITESWALAGNAGFTRLLGDAGDSPMVAVRGDANQFVAGIFVIYSF
jgi:outer membrane scaffolding protein for murein synthesis (MipA/OmpV family)